VKGAMVLPRAKRKGGGTFLPALRRPLKDILGVRRVGDPEKKGMEDSHYKKNT